MSIQSINLENFTVFDNIKCEFSKGLNILIGENGTGKTHLLKVLYAATQTSNYKKSFNAEKTFKGKTVAVTNNYDQVILPLFQAPVEGLDINLVRNKPSKNESAKVEIQASNGEITAYVAGLDLCVAVNQADINGKLFEQEALFIPAKDMLSHSGLESDYAKRMLPFDMTQINILNDLKVSRLREHTELAKTLTNKIADILGGKVIYRNGGYYIDRGSSQSNISLEAEGFKKLAVLYRALDTGYFQPGSVLFWDEPEANLNPKLIPVIADVLMELSRNGVQVFLATHDYNLMKYFSIKKKDSDQVSFISLHKHDGSVVCEVEEDYNLLEHNAIVEAGIKLLEDDIEGVFGDAN